MTQLVNVSPLPTPNTLLAERQQMTVVLPGGSACPNLSQALSTARDRCKAASKDGNNTFHKYRYASADEIIATASEALQGSGLALLPIKEELVVIGAGNASFYAINRTLILSHASGEFTTLEIRGFPVVPDKGRPLDKAYLSALTASLSYKLRDLLQMPRGDQHDPSARDDRQLEAPPPPQQYVASQPQPEPQPAPPPAAYGQQENPYPNQPAPVTPPATDELTDQEYEALASLAREHRRSQGEVNAICQALQIPVFRKVPKSRLAWVQQALIQGFASPTQTDQLAGLVTTLKLDWTAIRLRLQTQFGVSSFGHLMPAEADQLIAKLTAALQQQQAAA